MKSFNYFFSKLILLAALMAFSCGEDNPTEDPIDETAVGYFSVNGVQHKLSEAVLVHANGKWHSLIIFDGMDFSLDNEDWLVGNGNLVFLDILSGRGKFDITGNYTNNTGTFDGTDEDVANMKDLNIYNGFAVIANDYNFSSDSPEENNIADSFENENYENWSMSISESQDIYTISISFDADDKEIEIYYVGPVETYED